MQNNNITNKLYFKFTSIKGKFRVAYFKLSGMSIGENTQLGKIEAECPGSIIVGKNCIIKSGSTFWVQSPFTSSNRISIGDNVFIGRNVEFNCCGSIDIGNNCLIASSTIFVDSNHTFSKEKIIDQQSIMVKSIVVEEDVWVGSGCTVLYGVHLGKGCIIGAGAVVNKSVPAYEIWAGVPAKKIGERK